MSTGYSNLSVGIYKHGEINRSSRKALGLQCYKNQYSCIHDAIKILNACILQVVRHLRPPRLLVAYVCSACNEHESSAQYQLATACASVVAIQKRRKIKQMKIEILTVCDESFSCCCNRSPASSHGVTPNTA